MMQRRLRLRIEIEGEFDGGTSENVLKSFDKFRQDLHHVGGMERIEISMDLGPYVPLGKQASDKT
jgi:hypothetical protein